MMKVTDLLRPFNARIDRAISPHEDRRRIYEEWVEDIEFDRAVYLGSGRDNAGMARRLEPTGRSSPSTLT